MDTYSTKPPKPGAIEENAALFETDLAQARTVRGSALSRLERLRAARANHAQREQKWLEAKSGKDYPDVIRLKAEVEVEQRFGTALKAEIDRVSITAPVVDERAWSVYGFVRDRDLRAQPNLTVALFDRSNRWIDAVGHACTDSRGYFQLRYAPPGEPAAERFPEVFIHVSNEKQEVLYRDKKPMKAAVGGVQYRGIILGDVCATCPPPGDTPSPKPPGPRKSSKASKSPKARSTKKVRKDRKT